MQLMGCLASMPDFALQLKWVGRAHRVVREQASMQVKESACVHVRRSGHGAPSSGHV